MAIIDLGNIRINWRGAYDATVAYVKDDAVSYKGSSFIAKSNVRGITPGSIQHWDIMAAGSVETLTHKGDLLIHDGNMPVRLPCGNNTQVLQMIEGLPAWRNFSPDTSRRVWKLSKVNGFGSWHTRVYLMEDGTIRACGYGENHANGSPAAAHIWLPSRVAAEDPQVRFTEVFSGGLQHYAIDTEGLVWSWGHNNYGQLGHGDTINRAIAKRIDFFAKNKIKIIRVIPGRPNYHEGGCALFLAADGCLYGCGYNGQGNLGTGTSAHQSTPVGCGALQNIIDVVISGMPYTVYAIEEGGSLWVWGHNNCGQLGLGDTIQRETPVLHPSLENVKKAIPYAGYSTDGKESGGSGIVLTTNGILFTVGNNNGGQLGLEDTNNRSDFSEIISFDTFTDIAAGDGWYGSCSAITTEQELYVWGHNNHGMLGVGDLNKRDEPEYPRGEFQGRVTKVVMAGGSGYGGIILQAGNELWAAGYGDNGNIGIGTATAENNIFKKVLGISGKIVDWGAFGQGTTDWGLGVLYDDGRVDACGTNEDYGETGTQAGNLHNARILANVIL